jgi:hypothetical protein
MSETLAYCGLICQTCPIWLASRIEDKTEKLRQKSEIARLCRENYGMQYQPEDITDCDGCGAENDRIFASCRVCAIRNCAREKEVENCAFCDEYACDKLKAFFATESNAKMRLDMIRDEK